MRSEAEIREKSEITFKLMLISKGREKEYWQNTRKTLLWVLGDGLMAYPEILCVERREKDTS